MTGRVDLRRLAWLPIPVLLAAILALWAADLPTAHESEALLAVCNFLFSTAASLLVVILIGRSFIAQRTPGLLLVGCGALIWGAAGTLVPVLFPYGTNALLSGHNSLVWFSSLCYLTGVLVSLNPRRALRWPGLVLACAYIGALCLVGLVTMLAVQGWTPLFFVQGHGGTPLRTFVLGSALVMFAVTAAVLWRASRPSPSPFIRWYAAALLLVATGLLGIMLESVHGGALSWAGRAAQFLGGAYMLIAAIASVRESGAWQVSLEAALRESEDRFRLVVEGLKDHAIFMLDPDGRVVSWNAGAQRIKGYAAEEIIGQDFSRFYPPEDVAAGKPQRELAIAAEKGQYAEEGWRVRKDGSRFWADVTITALRDEAGELRGFAKLLEDITARKRAEEVIAADLAAMSLLQQIGARFVKAGQLADVAGEIVEAAIAIMHADMGNMQLFDPQTGRLKIAAFRGFEQAFLDFWNAVAEGQGACGTAMKNAQRMIVEDVAQSPIFVGTPALQMQLDAGVRAVQSTPLFSRSGDLIGMLSTHWHVPHRPDQRELHLLDLLAQQAVDIVERARAEEALRRSEEEFRALFDNMQDGFAHCQIVLDDAGRPVDFIYLNVNGAFGRLTGLENVVGKRVSDVLPGIHQVQPELLQTYARVAHTGTPEWFEIDFKPLAMWLSVAVYSSQPGQFAAVFANITDRKRAQEALQAAKVSAEQAKVAAETASKAKDHFLAVLSHELRTPLAPVVTTLAMLQEDPRFDADTRDNLEMIRRNVELEARLIDDLLDVTRIERGKVELDRQPVELCTIVRGAAEVCMPDIEARKLEFGIDTPDGPYVVDADPARLQQVFWNLLKNAIKFTPHGGCVGIRCRRDGHGHVIAQVNDSGVGIDPELLPRLFNAFEQGDRRVTRQFGGLGLGLAISKAITEMHGGSLTAHSQGKGKGATFAVRLPLASAELTARSAEAKTPQHSAPSTQHSRLRILLVEDHGDTARVMRMLLTADGHEVDVAGDVAAALKLAEEKTFDLMLSDLGLPDGSGLDLMRALRGRGISMPGIALSGFGQEQDMRQSREAGFAAHLVKPVSVPRLEEAIARAVGHGTGVAEEDEKRT